MKAILITKYGGTEVLQVKEVPNPWPKENEILIKIHAAAINNTDIVFRKGKPFVSRFFTGLLKPKHYIPGDVLAGKVIEIGNNVTRFKIGDYVYGYSTDTFGAYAEYKCLPENSAITIIPENISFEEAAGIVDGGHTALVFLRDKGNINNKQKVLIYGASGSVGTAAIQIANSYGAEVIAIITKISLSFTWIMNLTVTID